MNINVRYPDINDEARTLAEQEGCRFCKQARKAVSIFNSKVPPDQMIDICRPGDDQYDLINSIAKKRGWPWETPVLVFDRIWVEGASDWVMYLSFLKELNKGV